MVIDFFLNSSNLVKFGKFNNSEKIFFFYFQKIINSKNRIIYFFNLEKF